MSNFFGLSNKKTAKHMLGGFLLANKLGVYWPI